MSMQWFRLYNRIIDDRKVKLLAFEDRWHFVAICCLKSLGELNEPDEDLRIRQVALALGVQRSELDEIARRLRAVKLIDADLNPVSWDKLQFKHETSTKRVRAFRAKKQKAGKANNNKAATGVKRHETVSETPPETETETETEVLEVNTSCASGDAPKLKAVHLKDEWNKTVAAHTGRPSIRDLTPSRQELCRHRIAQYSLDDFVTVFGKVKASPFLRGDLGWKGATFDWTLKRANFQKILEGNYDE